MYSNCFVLSGLSCCQSYLIIIVDTYVSEKRDTCLLEVIIYQVRINPSPKAAGATVCTHTAAWSLEDGSLMKRPAERPVSAGMWAAAVVLLLGLANVSGEAPICLPRTSMPASGALSFLETADSDTAAVAGAPKAAKGVYFRLATASFSLPSDGVSYAIANQGKVLPMFVADVAEITRQTSDKVRAYSITPGKDAMKIAFSFTNEATHGSMEAFAAGAGVFPFNRTNKATAPHKATFLGSETTKWLNTCAFCRRFLQNLADGKTAKCSGENAAACKEQLDGLETDCRAAANETCCRATAAALATISPTVDKCAKAVCPPIVPVCPVNTKLKCRSEWESCCFDPSTDCSSGTQISTTFTRYCKRPVNDDNCYFAESLLVCLSFSRLSRAFPGRRAPRRS